MSYSVIVYVCVSVLAAVKHMHLHLHRWRSDTCTRDEIRPTGILSRLCYVMSVTLKL